MRRTALILIALVVLLLPACNPLSKLGEKAVKQNRTNVEYLGKQLTKYLNKDAAADRDVIEDKKLAIERSVSLAQKMEKQFTEDKE